MIDKSTPPASRNLRVAFLVGGDDAPTRASIDAVCCLPGIEPAAILLDTAVVPFSRRCKNLSRNIRANGWRYIPHRLLESLYSVTEAAMERAAVSPGEVRAALRKAFPDRHFSLAELGAKYRMTVHAVGNLNGAHATKVLNECGAMLGIVLGTRVLKPGIFSVPSMGCINLHKGKVPEYRGMPPGFWELYDGAESAGVTVHFVDQGLDTGDVVAASTVPIAQHETPESLRQKLHEEGSRLLAQAVAALRDGTATRLAQKPGAHKARTRPTLREEAALRRRSPRWSPKSGASAVARNLFHLLIYFSGLYALVRRWRTLRGRSRGVIFLYHRVNDYSRDPLTIDTYHFAAQLLALSQRYSLSSTQDLVDSVRSRQPIRPTTVAIHFDDCYRDVLTEGGPILKALGIRACAFVNSGYVDTDRVFPHDSAKYPFRYENLRSEDLRIWMEQRFEIGAHTVNHIDMGRCTREVAEAEVVSCGVALAGIVGRPVTVFSFPFGRLDNICPEAREAVARAGYSALFSAHGGFVGPDTDPYDIPRIGGASASALYALLQVEGLALSQFARAARRLIR